MKSIYNLYEETKAGKIIQFIYSNKFMYNLYAKLYPLLPIYGEYSIAKYNSESINKAHAKIIKRIEEYGSALFNSTDIKRKLNKYEIKTELYDINRLHKIVFISLYLYFDDEINMVFSEGAFLLSNDKLIYWSEHYSLESIIDAINYVKSVTNN